MRSYKLHIYLGLVLFLILNSCGSYDRYFHKVKNNMVEFSSVVDYIKSEKLFELKDSINMQKNMIHNSKSVTLYREDLKDSLLNHFMKKFDIDRITLEKRHDNFYNQVIVFHKDYNPITGSSKRINYDFGVSPIRDNIKIDVKKSMYRDFKIIDSSFIYYVNKRPSFGE